MANYSSFVQLTPRPANTSRYTDDYSLGPFLEIPGKVTFDFTLLFEETILSILPLAVLLISIPPRLLRLWRRPRVVKTSGYLQTTKIILLAIFSVLQLVNVVEVSRSSLQTRASLAAALLALVAALGLCVLSYTEHIRNIRPSSIINFYIFLTIPLDAAQLRTRWLRGDNIGVNSVASAILAIKLMILISEATEKRGLLSSSDATISPEATSGIYSRGVFWWLNPLFRLGFKNVVVDDDLFVTDSYLLSSSLEVTFNKYWINRHKYPKKHNLVWVTLRTILLPLVSAVVPRLIMTFFRFMQPLLIRSITQLVSDPESPNSSSHGWGLTAAFGLVYIGLALSGGAYQHKTNRVATMVRGALVNVIYSQTLDLSITSLDETAAVTLMSSDVERICEAILSIHNIWASPIEIALAIWLLQKEIGIALLGPLLVTAMAISGPFILSKYMGKAQVNWIQGIQTRIDATAKMLQGMKGVKMLGLSERAAGILSQLRLDEISKSLEMRKLFIVMLAFGFVNSSIGSKSCASQCEDLLIKLIRNMSDIFAPGAAFIIYVAVASSNGQTLEVTSAFTALSLIALLVAPIRAIVFATPPLIAAVSCIDRIETFLSLPTRSDHRMIVSSHNQSSDRARLIESPGQMASGSELELHEMVARGESSTPPSIVCLINLTLGWAVDGAPVIGDISCDFKPGLSMILGPIGSGKSSLVQGILGETPSSKGQVYVDQLHAGYVAQAPWIQNDTIRSNIIGFSVFEPAWYASVVYACALDTDIEAFSDGDLTKVGSAGIALSGGQKLRIGLARAVYSREKILILDDVFSGLDATNEERIFSRLLGKTGLLKRSRAIVILITHAAHRLSYADYIVALKADGTLAEQGDFHSLKKSDGYVAGLTTRHKTEEDGALRTECPATKVSEKDMQLENATADLNRPVGNWEIYYYYFASIGIRTTLAWACLMTVYSMLMRFPDIWFKFWTSAIAAHGNSINGLYLGVLLGAEITSIATLMALTFMLFVLMIPRSAKYFHERLLQAVENAPLSFFTTTDTGQIVNRFSQDLSVIDMELPLAGLILAFNSFMAFIQAVVICVSTSYFAIVLPFVAFAMYMLQKFYLRTSRQIRLMDLEAKAPLYSNFLETLSGLVTIRAFGWGENMKKRNMELLDASQRPFYLLYCIQRWLALVVDLMVAALAVILVALIVRFRHGADAGFVGVALINIMSFNTSLSVVVMNWTAIETSLGAVQRIKTFVEDTSSEHLPEESGEVPFGWPAQGQIVFSNVSAVYALDQPSALRNISLSILSGQKLGVCGPSGSGKSSFVALLLHLLEIQEGTLTIDDIDLAKLPRRTLREGLTVIPQEPVFLKGSIHQNLDPLNVASATEAEIVLQKVGLWSIVSTAGGLDSPMDAEELLSHGQRQLFCLARAMLKPAKILIIDEATASVDVDTDQLMQEIISEHFADCTVIAVAHRLQTIRDFDRIVVFEDGRIVEYGEPSALLDEEGSRFKALWNA